MKKSKTGRTLNNHTSSATPDQSNSGPESIYDPELSQSKIASWPVEKQLQMAEKMEGWAEQIRAAAGQDASKPDGGSPSRKLGALVVLDRRVKEVSSVLHALLDQISKHPLDEKADYELYLREAFEELAFSTEDRLREALRECEAAVMADVPKFGLE